MDTFEIPPFYIGQEIVAIKDHSQGAFKKGDEFIVTDCYRNNCKCKMWGVTIGINHTTSSHNCTACNTYNLTNLSKEWFFNVTCFAPKIQLSEFVSLKQFSEQQLELISAN